MVPQPSDTGRHIVENNLGEGTNLDSQEPLSHVRFRSKGSAADEATALRQFVYVDDDLHQRKELLRSENREVDVTTACKEPSKSLVRSAFNIICPFFTSSNLLSRQIIFTEDGFRTKLSYSHVSPVDSQSESFTIRAISADDLLVTGLTARDLLDVVKQQSFPEVTPIDLSNRQLSRAIKRQLGKRTDITGPR